MPSPNPTAAQSAAEAAIMSFFIVVFFPAQPSVPLREREDSERTASRHDKRARTVPRPFAPFITFLTLFVIIFPLVFIERIRPARHSPKAFYALDTANYTKLFSCAQPPLPPERVTTTQEPLAFRPLFIGVSAKILLPARETDSEIKFFAPVRRQQGRRGAGGSPESMPTIAMPWRFAKSTTFARSSSNSRPA